MTVGSRGRLAERARRSQFTLGWLFVVAVAACSQATEEPAPAITPAVVVEAKPPPRPAQVTRVTIKALGMYCEESCPLKVRYALADIPAVYELGFDVATESIFISYDTALGTAKQVTKPMLVAIRSAGFDPWLAKESWPAAAPVQVVPR
ncbi:MAG: hypothetical protein ABI867_37165 [Kofleriaceae bacterium]